MKGSGIIIAALCMIFISLTVSAAKNASDQEKGSTYDVYENSERLVALTFDDGPKEGKTDVILDMLKEKNVHATFFMIGAQVEDNSNLVKRLYEEGHQIGIHTYHHVDLYCLSEEEQREEIEKTEAVIQTITGNTDPLTVRPPYGRMNAVFEEWIDRPLILWSVDTLDWTGKTASQMIQETSENVKDGDIILMHDISENGLEGAAGIIDELKRMGYTFLTIDQLFRAKNIELENGVSYRRAR
ncbi:polysaccharide deacetylase family protein [Frisingicoccus sp.]|uniref:polysaccharide deacetylase family protein n=1 Tax=Frisingicoccus sp. TaxID=1918627 RepID=UPI00373686A8